MPNEAYLVFSLLTDADVFQDGIKRIAGTL
jgi:hypothetical protein